jgi:DNA-binding NarL/FixJ family response regulator
VIRLLLADDQALVRRGLRMILEAEPDFRVVAEAADGHEALARAVAHMPDVILMDLRMPNLDGIAAIERLPTDAKVLVLTTFSADAQVYAALRAGASGYLLKTAPPEQLVAAVRTVAAGDALLDPRITRRLIQEAVSGPAPGAGKAALSSLTDREVEVLEQVARGRSNTEIAAAVLLSEATVKTYLGRVMTKTGARSRAQLVVLAYETGLVRPGDAVITAHPE